MFKLKSRLHCFSSSPVESIENDYQTQVDSPLEYFVHFIGIKHIEMNGREVRMASVVYIDLRY